MSVLRKIPPIMSTLAEHTALWEKLCADPKFNDLPYKIETDRFHRLLMSPAKSEHSYWQTEIAHLLRTLLPDGKALVECAVVTPEGVKVADVGWFTAKRFGIIRKQTACSVAPQIAVEVLSDSNTRHELEAKRALYFDRGAEEFWLCDTEGRLTFFDQSGSLPHTRLCPGFPAVLEG